MVEVFVGLCRGVSGCGGVVGLIDGDVPGCRTVGAIVEVAAHIGTIAEEAVCFATVEQYDDGRQI